MRVTLEIRFHVHMLYSQKFEFPNWLWLLVWKDIFWIHNKLISNIKYITNDPRIWKIWRALYKVKMCTRFKSIDFINAQRSSSSDKDGEGWLILTVTSVTRYCKLYTAGRNCDNNSEIYGGNNIDNEYNKVPRGTRFNKWNYTVGLITIYCNVLVARSTSVEVMGDRAEQPVTIDVWVIARYSAAASTFTGNVNEAPGVERPRIFAYSP